MARDVKILKRYFLPTFISGFEKSLNLEFHAPIINWIVCVIRVNFLSSYVYSRH